MAAVPADPSTQNKSAERNFCFSQRFYQVPSPKRVQEYQMKVSLITASTYKYWCFTLKIDSWVLPFVFLGLCP